MILSIHHWLQIAKAIAAQNLLKGLPEEIKNLDKKKKVKRKFPGSGYGGRGGYGGGGNYSKPYVYDPATYIQVPPPEVTTPPEKFVEVGPDGTVLTAGLPTPAKSNKPEGGISGKMVHAVIQNPNPISALHEYCKKGDTGWVAKWKDSRNNNKTPTSSFVF